MLLGVCAGLGHVILRTGSMTKKKKESYKALPLALESLSKLFSGLDMCDGLTRIKLIFFAVAGEGLCFGFVLNMVLIMQGCFSYC